MKIFAVTVLSVFFVGPAFAITESEAEKLAPGDLCTTSDRDFSELRYPENIPYCVRNVSSSRKDAIKRKWGVPESLWKKYQVDHVNSLMFGGSNSDKNLMPLHYTVHAEKQHVESVLYDLIKKGQVTQALAIDMLAQWRHACLFNDQCEEFNGCVDEWVAQGAPGIFTCSL